MVPLSEHTLALVNKMIPPELRECVVDVLENECADNLPFLEDATPERGSWHNAPKRGNKGSCRR